MAQKNLWNYQNGPHALNRMRFLSLLKHFTKKKLTDKCATFPMHNAFSKSSILLYLLFNFGKNF